MDEQRCSFHPIGVACPSPQVLQLNKFCAFNAACLITVVYICLLSPGVGE